MRLTNRLFALGSLAYDALTRPYPASLALPKTYPARTPAKQLPNGYPDLPTPTQYWPMPIPSNQRARRYAHEVNPIRSIESDLEYI